MMVPVLLCYGTRPARLQRKPARLNKLIWKNVSQKWNFDHATFDRTAPSFNNPDHVSILIHNFRWRLSLSHGEPQYDTLDQQLSEVPLITIPTITTASDFDVHASD